MLTKQFARGQDMENIPAADLLFGAVADNTAADNTAAGFYPDS